MRLIAILLEPFIPKITKRVIDQLLYDNDRLNREWKQKHYEMEQEMYYWKDKYMDEVVYEPDKKD